MFSLHAIAVNRDQEHDVQQQRAVVVVSSANGGQRVCREADKRLFSVSHAAA